MVWVVVFLVGAVSWTLLEYVLHRWVMHEITIPTVMRTEHLEHHRRRDYYASNAVKAKASGSVAVVLLGIGVPLAGWALALTYTSGVILTYLAYEAFHRALHVREPRTAFGRWARRHHLYHHHGDPFRNHGVTSPVWDWVFGTLVVPEEKVRVPAVKRPTWLVNEADFPEYEVIGASRRPEAAEAPVAAYS